MRKILESLYRHKFFSLSGGVVISNALSLLTMPLFSRIYPVEGFGYFAVFWSLATILGVFATIRLELALPIIEDPIERLKVAQTSWFFSLVTAGVFLLVWYGTPLPTLFKSLPVGPYFGLSVALGALIIAALQIQMQLSIRLGYLNVISLRYISEKLVVILVSIILAHFADYGLILAQLAGLVASALILIYANKSLNAFLPALNGMLPLLKKYRDFPCKNGPATMLQLLTSQLPPLIYAVLFPAHLLGLYNLAQRLIDAPNAFVSNALSVVYYRRMLSANKTDMKRILNRTIRILILAMIPPMVAVALFSKPLMVYAFGGQWEEAHVFLLLLLPMAFFRMLFVAGQGLFLILRQLNLDLLVAAAVFVSTIAGMVLGFELFGTLEGSVGVSSALTSVAFLAGLFLIDRTAKLSMKETQI